ncbi:hypothetical protein [Chitinasiproducens palmae]|uniref:ATPase n=1 Tax=Chitinasiproducens palmae TaxID=1770053 RepID=A0A1H2PMW3_9BURK|nr:hypothetical protein [Chitinasiproducens palmae]SDV48010.1 hypothetical protein SAMN05216551_10477 [Chitinasiproducens palmae]
MLGLARTQLDMLNELDSLSHNIGRLLDANERNRKRVRELEQQLAEAASQRDEKASALVRAEAARDELQQERDALVARIDDAQTRLRAILERLPVAPQPDGDDAASEADAEAEATDAHETPEAEHEPSSDDSHYVHDR